MKKKLLLFISMFLATNFLLAQPLTLNVLSVTGQPGDHVCVSIAVQDFTNIQGAQMSFNYDPALVTFTGAGNFNPGVSALDGTAFVTPSTGVITFQWLGPSSGTTLTDGEIFFDLCFDIIGSLGAQSPVTIEDEPTFIEITDSNNINIGLEFTNGYVFISTDVLHAYATQDSVSCPDADDGAFHLTITGGTTPYDITYQHSSGGTAITGTLNIDGGVFTATGLVKGVYTISISDNSGHNFNTTVEILSSTAYGVNIVEIVPIQCHGGVGDLMAQITPPAADMTFSWNTTETTQTVTDKPSGLYSVTVTDNRGCIFFDSGFIGEPLPLNIDPSIQDNTCSGLADGVVTVNVSGGTPDASGRYSISWPHVPITVQGTTLQITGQTEGTYEVFVVDDNGCKDSLDVTITPITVLTDVSTIHHVNCFGGNDGQINVSGFANGFNIPFNFTWTGSPTPPASTDSGNNSILDDLTIGEYYLYMEDPNSGCNISDTFQITQPTQLIATLDTKTDASCVPGNDGTASLTVSGGTPGYNFDWGITPNQDAPSVNNLASGNYVVTVTDNNNCQATVPFEISLPDGPQIVSLPDDHLDCADGTDGSLSVTAIPGSGAITDYNWSPSGTGENITGLSAGQYIVTVVDNLGCWDTDTALVIAPQALSQDNVQVFKPTCPGDSDGSVIVNISGGTTPYSYIWSTAPGVEVNNNQESGLTAGIYSVTVTDANNCTPLIVSNIIVEDPPAITPHTMDLQPVSCYNQTCDGVATISADYSDNTTGNFTFAWSSGETETGISSSTAHQLCQGSQSVTISDGVCQTVHSFEIDSPAELGINTSNTIIHNVSCFGGSDGSITVAGSGGTPPYSYNWGSTVSDNIQNLPIGDYTVTVTDDNNCDFQHTFSILQPELLVLTIDTPITHDVTCYGEADGVIGVNILGGNPGNHAFHWDGTVATGAVASSLPPGNYSVTVTDEKGCEAQLPHTITEPDPITFSIVEPDPIKCHGDETFIVVTDVSGGQQGIYQFTVDNTVTRIIGDSIIVTAGPHIVTVYDVNGCSTSENFPITQPQEIEIFFDSTYLEIELGDSLMLNPQISPPGTHIDSLVWLPDFQLSSTDTLTPVVTPFEDQSYTLQVWDENGCSGIGNVNVLIDRNRNVYIPNIFSPNNDGPNDFFHIYTGNGVKQIKSVNIFSRWGSLVFSAKNLQPSGIDGIKLWDGKFKGKRMNSGVYIYIIDVEFLDGVELLYRGDITLVR